MKNAVENRPGHIVRGNVFDALGFSASEASALKIKAELLSAILEHIRVKGYTQAQLADVLDEYQPSVSNLLRGRISQVSIEKLLRYADRLHLQTSIAVRSIEGGSRGTTSRRKKTQHPARKRRAIYLGQGCHSSLRKNNSVCGDRLFLSEKRAKDSI